MAKPLPRCLRELRRMREQLHCSRVAICSAAVQTRFGTGRVYVPASGGCQTTTKGEIFDQGGATSSVTPLMGHLGH